MTPSPLGKSLHGFEVSHGPASIFSTHLSLFEFE